ncbi:acyl-CoA dehydrogenase family protein [Desulfosporosinus sp.]|uniref:acyl-CoA dehydrogenase family protein n=1 Tax=Desulfosporosinus sp. TaxID=157907 RepID=UPI0025BD1ACF|nr:acyl-CoA dehydrogenase family protein [Desulfosporosinus sp.]MBC2726635.1 acyl-CoA/acyl-ACP dehydrogenase [Desulfosporosinus sp.]
MDFTLTIEQEMLRQSARKFLNTNFTSDYVREMWENTQGYEPEMWTKIADLGWMGLTIPEEYGGLGLTFRDLGVILHEMGRVVMPGPFFSTVVLATELIKMAGSEAQRSNLLEKIASGKLIATVALYEEEVEWGADGIKLSATKNGESYSLLGTKLFVPDAHCADLIIVAARTQKHVDVNEGISLFLVDPQAEGVKIERLPTMDHGRKQCAVSFLNTTVSSNEILGEVGKGWIILEKMLTRANIALGLEMLGGGEKVLEIATEYSKVRVQFGQPIGSYQAIKHKCAEMLLQVESSRSIAEYAAWTVDGNPHEESKSASLAKTYVGNMYRKAAAATLQILGGIGFSWEHDIHLYYKRALASEAMFGDTVFHLEHLASQWD